MTELYTGEEHFYGEIMKLSKPSGGAAYIRQLARVFRLVKTHFEGDTSLAIKWLLTPLRVAGNLTPKALIREGRSDLAIAILQNEHLRDPEEITVRKIIS